MSIDGTDKQLTTLEMIGVVADAQAELERLKSRELKLETIIHMASAALIDETANQEQRIENALRFLRTEAFVL